MNPILSRIRQFRHFAGMALLAAFLSVAQSAAHAAITYVASASNPADNSSLGTSPVAVAPPGGMVAGDLVILVANARVNNVTMGMSATGGQAWTAQTNINTTGSQRIFWARYNGSWTAPNPSVTFSDSTNTTVVMHVFRPSSGANTWAIDVAQTNSTSTGGAVTIPGITTNTDGALVFATWTSTDNNTWALQTAGWANAGGAQYRNQQSTDASQSSAYLVKTTAGATGDVVNSQTGGGIDAGNISILAFREVPPFPTVVSINRTSANPTAPATAVSWVVVFNASVTGVDPTDFSLAPTGTVSGASITGATGGGTTWTVTADTGTGYGTLGLNLVDDDSIKDGGLVPLGGTGNGNGNFTGQLYDIPAPNVCNTGTISGVINTYYVGAASVAAGATQITVGASSGAGTLITQGDLILIMQMQDAAIVTSNTSGYGAASAVNAGKYEYATVASVIGTTITLTAPLNNGYTYLAGSDTVSQKTFQVIRVPVYSTATLGAATAKAWDGSTGGVLAFDVTGTLTLAGATADVSGTGFRGGATRVLAGGAGTDTDYRTLATVNTNGPKGEGIAGTPRYIFTAPGTVTNTGVEGYASGSHARGSPANGGGGGSDGNPAANDQNTGGGGGGNGGAGGMGGIAWCPTFNAGNPPNYGCDPYGGLGGKTVAELGAGQLTLGGGGGGGTANNVTGSGACAATAGACGSGAAGGGVIMVRAGTLSGSGTFNASGRNGDSTVGNDGSGGGGAGGAVLLLAASHTGGTATINANGGSGGSNLIPPLSSGPHGPGGGGGGGYVVRSGAVTTTVGVAGGAAGVTYNNGTLFGTYGSTPGAAGQSLATLSPGQIPGAALGSGPCAVPLDHYAISYPLGNPGVTCEPLAVRITGHDNAHVAVPPVAGTQITLTTSVATTGGWTLKTGAGTFTAPNQYTFNGTEDYAEFWLSQSTALANININVTDGAKTDIGCTVNCNGTEDEWAEFRDAAFKYYACTGAVPATCSEATVGNQIAGKASNVAPGAQNLYVRAMRTNPATGACVSALIGPQNVNFAYECNNPATCYAANLASINGTTINRNNNGTVTASSGSFQSVGLTFDASGYAPVNLTYLDVGAITLHARRSVSGTVVYGATNSFVVRPYAFTLADIKCTTTPASCAPLNATGNNPAAADATGASFIQAGNAFSMTVSAVTTGGVVTPSFGRESVAEGVAFVHDLVGPTGGQVGALSGTTAIAGATFQAGATKGVATITNLIWNEVGIIGLTARVGDGNYLDASVDTNGSIAAGSNSLTVVSATNIEVGTRLAVVGAGSGGGVLATTVTAVAGTTVTLAAAAQTGVAGAAVFDIFGLSGNVGRFIPHHFNTVVTEACGGAFTYSGQPFGSSVITAYNGLATPTPTQNYLGANGYARDVTLEAKNSAGGDFAPGFGNLTPTAPQVASTEFKTGGTANFPSLTIPPPPSPAYTFGTKLTAPTVVRIRATDTDLASSSAGTEGTSNMRSGRLRISNAFGSEKADLSLAVQAHYWSGRSWVLNNADSCTNLPANAFFLVGAKPGTAVMSGLTLTGGVGTLTLTKPTASATATGSVDVAVNLGASGPDQSCLSTHGGTAANLPWLRSQNGNCAATYDRDPSARASFGIYSPETKKTIHVRELY